MVTPKFFMWVYIHKTTYKLLTVKNFDRALYLKSGFLILFLLFMLNAPHLKNDRMIIVRSFLNASSRLASLSLMRDKLLADIILSIVQIELITLRRRLHKRFNLTTYLFIITII